MLNSSLIQFLLSHAITLKRDKSILYSQTSITILILSSLIARGVLCFLFLKNNIGIFGGLFNYTSTSNRYKKYMKYITSMILLLISFYHRKVWLKEYSSINKLLFSKLTYYKILIVNKMGEQYKTIEYSLIRLFIVTGVVYFVSNDDSVPDSKAKKHSENSNYESPSPISRKRKRVPEELESPELESPETESPSKKRKRDSNEQDDSNNRDNKKKITESEDSNSEKDTNNNSQMGGDDPGDDNNDENFNSNSPEPTESEVENELETITEVLWNIFVNRRRYLRTHSYLSTFIISQLHPHDINRLPPRLRLIYSMRDDASQPDYRFILNHQFIRLLFEDYWEQQRLEREDIMVPRSHTQSDIVYTDQEIERYFFFWLDHGGRNVLLTFPPILSFGVFSCWRFNMWMYSFMVNIRYFIMPILSFILEFLLIEILSVLFILVFLIFILLIGPILPVHIILTILNVIWLAYRIYRRVRGLYIFSKNFVNLIKSGRSYIIILSYISITILLLLFFDNSLSVDFILCDAPRF